MVGGSPSCNQLVGPLQEKYGHSRQRAEEAYDDFLDEVDNNR